MDEESNDQLESVTEPTEEVVNTEEVEVEAPVVETEDNSELEEKNKKLFERAKKAEAELKALRAKAQEAPPPPPEKQDGLSSMDTIALIGAKVTVKEDIDEVVDYAKLKGITIAEALNSNVVKTILKDKAEQRQTAEATNTGTARRGTTKPSDDSLLANAEQGKFPEDPEALAEARMNLKLKK